MATMERILLIEDSLECVTMVEQILGAKFYVQVADSIQQARPLLHLNWDLILLETTLPDGLGFDFCTEIQNLKKNDCPPIVFLSGREEVQDRIRGWSLGADDYITKPFYPAEFLVRIQCRIKKYNSSLKNLNKTKWCNLILDVGFHETYMTQGTEDFKIDLTPIEFKLLYCFVKNADQVLSRQQLIEQAWGSVVHITERTVDKHISTLRQKLNTDQFSIKTISGLGYRLTQAQVLSSRASSH